MKYQVATVIFEADIHEDHIEEMLGHLKAMRYVADVKLGPPVEHQDHRARMRVREDIGGKLFDLAMAVRRGQKFTVEVEEPK